MDANYFEIEEKAPASPAPSQMTIQPRRSSAAAPEDKSRIDNLNCNYLYFEFELPHRFLC